MQKFKIDFNQHTALLDQHPELDVKDLIGNSNTAVAPGEGKIPTNVLTDPDWDIKTFVPYDSTHTPRRLDHIGIDDTFVLNDDSKVELFNEDTGSDHCGIRLTHLIKEQKLF